MLPALRCGVLHTALHLRITFKVSDGPFQRGAERSDAPSERPVPKGRAPHGARAETVCYGKAEPPTGAVAPSIRYRVT